MLPIAGVLALATSPVAKWIGAIAALAAAIGGAYLAIDARAVARCERDSALSVMHAQEEAHQENLAAIERGDKLAAELAQTQRRLDAKQAEYLRYAYGITGNCPASLGLLTSAASGGQATLPEATGEPANPPVADGSPEVAARLIGANIAINYARFQECIARYDALIDWHEANLK